MTNPVFISGAMRSGTTLAQKALSLHRMCDIRYQPFQELLVHVKRKFLASRMGNVPLHALQREYPLNDMLLGNSYDIAELVQYLSRATFEPTLRVSAVSSDSDVELKTGGLSLQEILRRFLGPTPEKGGVVGFKEVFCEEFSPYLADSGFRVILVIRDPRDVVTSTIAGEASKYCGRPRPMLFTLRQWRKSVAFGLGYADSPRLLVVRYEDLVENPAQEFARVTSFLRIGSYDFDIAKAQLRDDHGRPWRSNSSLAPSEGITSDSVGCHRRFLDPRLRRFVEATCNPELQALSYPVKMDSTEARATLEALVLEESLERPTLRDYLWSPSRRAEEIERLTRIETGDYSREMFIHPQAFVRLTGLGSTNHGTKSSQ